MVVFPPLKEGDSPPVHDLRSLFLRCDLKTLTEVIAGKLGSSVP